MVAKSGFGISQFSHSPRTLVFCRAFRDRHLEHYMPDLVTKFSLPGSLLIKATLMPTVLYRLERLLIAEEVRSTIASEAKLGYKEPPSGKNPLTVFLPRKRRGADIQLRDVCPQGDLLRTFRLAMPMDGVYQLPHYKAVLPSRFIAREHMAISPV